MGDMMGDGQQCWDEGYRRAVSDMDGVAALGNVEDMYGGGGYGTFLKQGNWYKRGRGGFQIGGTIPFTTYVFCSRNYLSFMKFTQTS